MVRSKKNSSSKKSLKNMPQSQLNNPKRNVNNLGDHTTNMNTQNYNIPNAATQLPGRFVNKKKLFGRISNVCILQEFVINNG